MIASPSNICTVLVFSCDDYNDVIVPFSDSWMRFWPDCPFDVVLTTETLPQSCEGLCFDRIIWTHRGAAWRDRIQKALETIKTPYVMLFCNDYFLNEQVDTKHILLRMEQACRLKVLNLRLCQSPQTDFIYDSSDTQLPLREYKKGTAFCISTQVGFWNKDFLKRLSAQTPSPWDFEIKGSSLVCGESGLILCTPQSEFPYYDAVHKGYWDDRARSWSLNAGVKIDFSIRGFAPCHIRLLRFLNRCGCAGIVPRSVIKFLKKHILRSEYL